MKLKDDLKIINDIENEVYVFEDLKGITPKKITSRMFPILLGENAFNSTGYGILERANLLVYVDDFDKWYGLRGEIAEIIAVKMLKDFYKHKHNVEIELKTFEPKQFKGYDMFHESYSYGNKDFGGVPDLTITNPKEHRAVIEVKSKNMKNYEWIFGDKDNHQVPEAEKMQGEQLAWLGRTDKLLMLYVFFTNEQEEIIKEALKNKQQAIDVINKHNWSYRTVKTVFKPYDLDLDQVHRFMLTAKSTLDSSIKSGTISHHHFNKKETEIIEAYIETNAPKVEVESGLPFDDVVEKKDKDELVDDDFSKGLPF